MTSRGLRNSLRKGASLASFLVLLVVPAAGLVSAQGPPSHPPGLDRAIAAQEAHTDALLTRAGVIGTAVGLAADGQPVVKIYTRAAGVRGLPADLDGVPVEVEVTGEIVAQSHSLTRPAAIGTSTGSDRLIVYRGLLYCTVGTLGARVSNGSSVYALSNAHVYALEGSKTNGTVQKGVNGDPSLQPGRVDMTDQACGSPHERDTAVIGRLWDYRPIVFSRTANNEIDAAIAKTTVDQVGTDTPADGYGGPSSTPVAASIGLEVQKYGRTTWLTTGAVTGVNATVIIKYDKGQARFVKQVVVQGDDGSTFSAGGDSGSLIVTSIGNHPVALLFAGSSSTTIGNPIALVLGAFGVTVDEGP